MQEISRKIHNLLKILTILNDAILHVKKSEI